MGEVAGEVVGAELVFGVQALVAQILGPARQQGPVFLGVPGMTVYVGQGGHEDQHVAALLDRHLVLLRALPAAVDLTVAERVRPEVVRGERELPVGRARVVEDRRQHGPQQVRVQEQEERGGWVSHVNSGDAAIRKVFFGQEQRRAVEVHGELMGGDTLAEGEGTEGGELLAAGLPQVGGDLGIEFLTTGRQAQIVGLGGLEQLADPRAVPAPVGADPAVEVFDGEDIVVGK